MAGRAALHPPYELLRCSALRSLRGIAFAIEASCVLLDASQMLNSVDTEYQTPSRQNGRTAVQADHSYWFPAKRYGWGWGLPASWEGWLVLLTFFVLILSGFFLFPPAKALGSFVSYTVVVGILLVAVCWLKGEPPRWRWGEG